MTKLWRKFKKWIIGLLIGGTALAIGLGAIPDTQPPVVQPSPTHFAEIDQNGIVLRVIVADQDFINSGAVGDPSRWIPTAKDGSLKKNYAGKGYTFRKDIDAFVAPKPHPNAVLDVTKGRWNYQIDTGTASTTK